MFDAVTRTFSDSLVEIDRLSIIHLYPEKNDFQFVGAFLA